MKIILNEEFKHKLSVISIFFAKLFQLYILFTLSDIEINGFNENNVILLIFNIFYILALHFYDEKINAILNLRGKYLSTKREKMNCEEINTDNQNILKKLFTEILDGDFRP